MRIEVARVFDIAVLRLHGQFVEELELVRHIRRLGKSDNLKVLVNFENVDYVNSNCLRSLARIHQLIIAHNGEVRLCSLKQNVRRLFTIANLDRGYQIYSCEDEGIISFYNNLPGEKTLPIEIVYSG
jgi:anti-anti-sigma factor